MAVKLKIDATNYNKYFTETLEGTEFLFHIYWNNSLLRRQFSNAGWYLSVYDPKLFNLTSLEEEQETALIYGGARILPNDFIFDKGVVDGLPLGKLCCVDMAPEKGKENETYFVGLDNFGTNKRFELVYFTSKEVQEHNL